MNKKHYIMALAAAFTISYGAAARAEFQHLGVQASLEEKMAENPAVRLDKNFILETLGVAELRENAAPQGVIYSPEGIIKPYKKLIMGLDWGENIQEDACTSIVFGSNGEVYFRDIVLRVASMAFGSYVKGTLENDVIKVPVPQTVVEYEGGYGREVVLMEKDASGEWQVSDLSEITYSYNPDTGTIKSDLPGNPGQYAIGIKWTFQDDWNEIGDFLQVYTPYDGEFTAVPDNVELEEYYYNDGYYAYPVQVGVDGSDLYIQGLSMASPSSVVKATIDGNRGYIPQDELLGTVMGYFIWTKMMVPDPVLGWALVPSDEVYGLDIDLENKIIRSADPGQILIFNCEFNRVFYLDGFVNFSLIVPTSFAGTPRNPFDISFNGEDFREYYGIYGFNFNLSNISKEGNILDTSCLYYSIYIDGDILEFEEIENLNGIMYPGVEGIVTRMPFDFSNGYDIDTTSDTGKFIGIYPDGVTTIGVQAIYQYQGETTVSDIVTLNVETGEFTDNSYVKPATAVEIVSMTYYDLSGRKVSEPESGMFIRLTTYADGSTKAEKIVR